MVFKSEPRFLQRSNDRVADCFLNRYTEAELQQALLGLKREHKESIEQMRKEQDEALFKVSFPPSLKPPNPLSDVSGTLCLKGGCKSKKVVLEFNPSA